MDPEVWFIFFKISFFLSLFLHQPVHDCSLFAFNANYTFSFKVFIGPLARETQLGFLEHLTHHAVRRGAEVLLGGKRVQGTRGFFFEPTVIGHCNHTMEIMHRYYLLSLPFQLSLLFSSLPAPPLPCLLPLLLSSLSLPPHLIASSSPTKFYSRESFGPIVGLQKVNNDDDAVSLMNDTQYGLTAAVYGKDEERCTSMLRDLNVGTCYWNACDRVSPYLPWTGPPPLLRFLLFCPLVSPFLPLDFIFFLVPRFPISTVLTN